MQSVCNTPERRTWHHTQSKLLRFAAGRTQQQSTPTHTHCMMHINMSWIMCAKLLGRICWAVLAEKQLVICAASSAWQLSAVAAAAAELLLRI